MSDPSNLRIPSLDALSGRLSVVGFGMTLQRAVAPGRHLRARCTRCAETSPIPAGYWLSRGFGPRPLSELEGRVRCICRSVDVTLEVALGDPHDQPRFYLMP
jgi:hypothetical protein